MQIICTKLKESIKSGVLEDGRAGYGLARSAGGHGRNKSKNREILH